MRSDQILARTMRYGDELTLLEQGKKVEREQFIENSYNPMTTMPQMLKQRVFSKAEDVRRWERRRAIAADPFNVTGIQDEYRAGPNPHRWPCEDPACRRCDDAVKRLLRDCGVLPRKGVRR